VTRPIAVLRPEPGNQVTAAAVEARGRIAIRLPLFEVRPLAWRMPDPARFDALVMTSANAVRHGGPGLAALLRLPVHAVGDATAQAARRAGFAIASVGNGGGAELVAAAAASGMRRALHIGGRERTLEPGGAIAEVIAVYASEALPIDRDAAHHLLGSIALIQSARAGQRLAALAEEHCLDRAEIALAAVSSAAAAAAGGGWRQIAVAAEPSAEALIDLALALPD